LQLEHEQIAALITEALVAEVRRLAQQVVELMYVPVEKRLWRRLNDLAIAFGSANERAEEIPVTQETLGQLAGCTRPTANRALRAGEVEGIITMGRGRITIVDPAALAKRAR